MRLVRPAPNVLGFYDGRIDGVRACSDEPNWLDDGAYAARDLHLCRCRWAAGARLRNAYFAATMRAMIRQTLEDMGVRSIRVVLSHWHDDHMPAMQCSQDCEIIANTLTASALANNRAEIEGGVPPIKPLVLPSRTFKGSA